MEGTKPWNRVERRYFRFDSRTKEVIAIQHSVIRTNCLDCLDRSVCSIEFHAGTNVVQTLYAQWMLFYQLFGLKCDAIMKNCASESGRGAMCRNLSNPHDIQHVFNNLWSDNADELSRFYSGSPSLKTDYTRLFD